MKNLRQAKGIELLPVGIYATNARLSIGRVDAQLFKDTVEGILQVNFAHYYDQAFTLKHIAITQGAFPEEEERQLIGYIAYCHQQIHDTDVRTLLLFGAFCILEEISFTRKTANIYVGTPVLTVLKERFLSIKGVFLHFEKQ